MLFKTLRQWCMDRPEVPVPLPNVMSHAAAKIDQLPAMSQTTIQAMKLSRDDNASIQDFVALVRKDGAITSLLMKVANSPVFRGSAHVDTIDRAVARLGMGQCTNLILAAGMRGSFQHKDPIVQRRCELLWQHCFFTASIASKLNMHMRLGLGGEEFTCGLLHDMGRLVMTVVDPAAASWADPIDFDEGPDTADREHRAIGTDHLELGAQFAARQHMPETVLECIQYHHDPELAPKHGRLVDLVSLADTLVNHVQRQHRVSDFDLEENASFQRLTSGWPDRARAAVAQVIPKVVRGAIRDTRAVVTK